MIKILFCSALLFSFLLTISKEKVTRVIDCPCDSMKVKSIILDKNFNSIQQFDTISYSERDFDNLSDSTKTLLWYRDIESPASTQFTRFWSGGKYERLAKTSIPTKLINRDSVFLDTYANRKDIELAFQLGPNNFDLWAYHYFIVKKVESCYLFTHSYYRHARFTFKSYSIIDELKLDSLRKTLDKINKESFTGQASIGYAGYFVDNRTNRKFFVDFKEKDAIKAGKYEQQIQDLVDIVFKKINWTVTYQL